MIMFFLGCAYTLEDFAPFTAESGTDVLLTTGDIDRPYKELGVIFVKASHARYEKVVEELKVKAKEVNADAVIKLEFNNRLSLIHRPYCRGVAVSFK